MEPADPADGKSAGEDALLVVAEDLGAAKDQRDSREKQAFLGTHIMEELCIIGIESVSLPAQIALKSSLTQGTLHAEGALSHSRRLDDIARYRRKAAQIPLAYVVWRVDGAETGEARYELLSA